MNNTSVKDLAEKLGKSKPTILRRIHDLDPAGHGYVMNGNKMCLRDDLVLKIIESFGAPDTMPADDAKAEKGKKASSNASQSANDAVLAAKNETIHALSDENKRLLSEIERLRSDIERQRLELAEKDRQIATLNTRVELARRLQGFTWPWQRRRILADYVGLLPEVTEQ